MTSETIDKEPATDACMAQLPAFLQTLVARCEPLRWPIYFCWRFAQRWENDRCPLLAAALAFFGLLSVFPMVLAGVAILSQNLVGNARSVSEFKKYVVSYFPGAASQIFDQIHTIASSTDAASVSLIAILSLLWSGRAYFDTLAAVLNTIWPRSRPRSLIGHQLALWGTFLGAGLSFVFSTAVTVALSAAQGLLQNSAQFASSLQPFWTFAGRFSSWLLTLIMFWLMYRFLPNVQGKRRGRLALVAALVASLSWELGKWVFTRYIGNVHRYGQTYGTFAGIVLTMMWIYFSSLIILMAAEVAGAYEETRTLCRGEDVEALAASDDKPEADDKQSLPPDQKTPILIDPTQTDDEAAMQRSTEPNRDTKL